MKKVSNTIVVCTTAIVQVSSIIMLITAPGVKIGKAGRQAHAKQFDKEYGYPSMVREETNLGALNKDWVRRPGEQKKDTMLLATDDKVAGLILFEQGDEVGESPKIRAVSLLKARSAEGQLIGHMGPSLREETFNPVVIDASACRECVITVVAKEDLLEDGVKGVVAYVDKDLSEGIKWMDGDVEMIYGGKQVYPFPDDIEASMEEGSETMTRTPVLALVTKAMIGKFGKDVMLPGSERDTDLITAGIMDQHGAVLAVWYKGMGYLFDQWRGKSIHEADKEFDWRVLGDQADPWKQLLDGSGADASIKISGLKATQASAKTLKASMKGLEEAQWEKYAKANPTNFADDDEESVRTTSRRNSWDSTGASEVLAGVARQICGQRNTEVSQGKLDDVDVHQLGAKHEQRSSTYRPGDSE